MRKALTAKGVAAVSPGPKRQEIPDAYVPGLYLVVQPSGAKSWAVRFRHLGKPCKQTLGSYPRMDLAGARGLAREQLQQVALGFDPRALRKAREHLGVTVAAAVQLYDETHLIPNTRPSTRREVGRLLTKNLVREFGALEISRVEPQHLMMLQDALSRRDARVSANRLLTVLRHFFRWCRAREFVEQSPCEHLRPQATERPRHRVLTEAEIRNIWKASEAIGWPFGPIMQLLFLTGQRRGEVGGMCWREVDLDTMTWSIPAEKAKNGQPHHVPLSTSAAELLGSLPRTSADFVFSTNGNTAVSGFSRAKSRVEKFLTDSGMAPIHDWRNHDIRRTVATNMARLSVPVQVIEKVLNHSSGTLGGIVGVYQRYSYRDETRVALNRWSEDLQRMIGEREYV